MILRLVSGSVTPGERVQEPLAGVDDLELDAGGGDEVLLDLLGLARAQQPVVDEHAGQLVADGLLHERRGDRGVDAAGQPADHARVADLRADLLDLLGDDVARRSSPGARPGALVEEVLERLLAERRVLDLGVPLHAEQAARAVLERGDRASPTTSRAPRSPRAPRAPRRRGSSTRSARPGCRPAPCPRRRPRPRCRRTRAAPVCATVAAERPRHRLEAVADAEHRDAGLEQRRVDRRARPSAYTDDGPPDRMIAAGSLAEQVARRDAVCGTISEYTLASRTRRAISCAYCAPKSTTRTGRWVVAAGSGVCVTRLRIVGGGPGPVTCPSRQPAPRKTVRSLSVPPRNVAPRAFPPPRRPRYPASERAHRAALVAGAVGSGASS